VRNAAIAATVAGVLLLVLVQWALGSASAGGRIPTAHVKRGPVTIKVVEAGELRARDQVTVSAINDKQILWLCPEGKYVRTGDTLVVFESEKYVISTDEAHSAYLVARAELEQAQNNLEAQKSKEEAAHQRYESLPELEKKGFVMESEVQQAKLAWMELQSTSKSYEASVTAPGTRRPRSCASSRRA
jgi:multidrug efflux pump subunit AcrA (membrane-fusion protein)